MVQATTEKREMHQSHLFSMQNCGEEYRRKYVLGERGIKSCPLIGGSAVHFGRDVNLSQKVKSKIDLEVEAVTEATRDCVVEMFADNDVDPGYEFAGLPKKSVCQQMIDKSVKMARADYEHFQVNIQPLDVEVGIGVALKNYPFDLGVKLDVVEPLDVFSDFKTSGRTPSKDIAETSQQLALYSLAYQAKYKKAARVMRLDYTVTLKTGMKCVSFEATPSRSFQQAILNRMATAYEATEKGIFVPCNTMHWKCGPKYCEFYHDCRYVGRQDRPEN